MSSSGYRDSLRPPLSTSEGSCLSSCKALRDSWAGSSVSVETCLVHADMEDTHCDGQVITSRQLCDLTNVPETGTHDNCLVAKLLVVVEDLHNAFDPWVFLGAVVLLVRCFVPVEDTADKRRNEVSACFGCSNGLGEGEHEG